MSQRHPLLTRWSGLGEEAAYRLPEETFSRLMDTLSAALHADLENILDGVEALHEIAVGGRSELTLEELLQVIEARIREARRYAASLTLLRRHAISRSKTKPNT